MAFVKVRVPRTCQPQGLAGIDRNNPLCAGLVAVAIPGLILGDGKHDIAGNLSGTSMKLSQGTQGIGVNGLTSSTDSYRLNAIANATDTVWEKPVTACTFASVLVRNGNQANGNAPIFSNCSPSASPYTAWGIFDWAGAGTNIVAEIAVGGINKHIDTNVSIENNVRHVLAGRYDGTQLNVFKDGKNIAGMAASGSITYPSAPDRGPALGNFYNYTGAARSFNGFIYLGALWDRSLSDIELADVSANPWQIFEPEERLIWIPDAVSVGGGATVIPIGQQATGSVGSPTATGAATTAATGVSAASAVGAPTAIAGTSIPATVTPAGVIAHASIGSLIATGAAWTVTGGVQAASAVGSPTAIAGTSIPATALPAGVSALASVGTPSANGASIAYAGGISAFSAVGAPTAIGGVSGQATALPAGVQAISYVGVPTATAAAVVYASGVQAIGYVGMPIALGDPVAFTPSVYQAISPAQSYTVTSPAQSYTAISPAQSYTVTVQPQTYIA
jgi:hypothetical protein